MVDRTGIGSVLLRFRRSPAAAQRRCAVFVTAALAVLVAATLVSSRPALAADAGSESSHLQLLMIEEAGCGFCARWMAEVAPGYQKSDEGRIAPLVVRERYDPAIKHLGRIVYTPTFILLRDGVERGRILGYPGPDFFWSMLGQLLKEEKQRAGSDADAKTTRDADASVKVQ